MSLVPIRVLPVICVLYIGICNIAYAEEQVTAEEQVIYDSHGKRDPFVPLVGDTSKKAIPPLEDVMSIEDVHLQGVASGSSSKKAAIINGEMIKEGETIGRLTIKKILRDKVILTIDEEEYSIDIYEVGGK